MANILQFNTEAQNSLLKGVNTLANAVASTLGPKGRNVAIQRPIRPQVVHDGVTVARSINLKDPFERMGAELVRDAAIKTNDVAGDGTTTATILTQAIVNEAFKHIQAGENPQTIKSEIEQSLVKVLEELAKLSKKISTDEEIEQVAIVSSSSPELGKLVAEAIKKVGKDGVVTVEEGNSFETTISYQEGLEVDRGFLSPYFVTNSKTEEAVLENPYILLTDLKISHNYDILPFVEKFVEAGHKDLVIFAATVDDEALNFLVINNMRMPKPINVIAIQAPSFGLKRIEELEDMAALTGGKVIMADSGRNLDSVTIEELGRADKVTSDRDKTIILGARGPKDVLKQRIEAIKVQLASLTSSYDKDVRKQRLAKLTGGVAVINVGANTEVELGEKKERVIDAVNATKAAIEEGIVAGGEVTLYYLATPGLKSILANALRRPFQKLVENSGDDYADTVRWMTGYPQGINVIKKAYENLIKAGIIDPVKVTRSALENACSVACMLLTTDTLIAEEPEK